MIFSIFDSPEEKAAGDLFDDKYWVGPGMFGRKTPSGAVVTPSSALTLDAYFACIRNISEDMAKLPFVVVEKMKDGSKKTLLDDPASRLMNVRPNTASKPQGWRETVTADAFGWGNGYAEIVRSGRGEPIELWHIHPSRVEYELQKNGRVQYRVWTDGGRFIELDQDDMFHLAGLGGDGVGGYPLAQLAAQTIGLGLDQEASSGSFVRNGSRLSGILTPNGTTGKEAMENLRKSWNSQFGGSENTGKVAALPHDVKFQALSIPANDAEMIASRKLTIESIARWTRMPPHKIAEMSGATYGNVEQGDIAYVRDTLLAWDARWHDEVKAKLIGLDNNVFGRHDFDMLLRGDTETRYKSYQVAMNAGIMKRNEARAKEDLEPVEGGDRLYVPLNYAPLGDDGLPMYDVMPQPRQGQTGGTPSDSHNNNRTRASVDLSPIIAATAERLVINETNALSRRKPDFDGAAFLAKMQNAIAESFEPIMAAARVSSPSGAARVVAVTYSQAWSKDDAPDQKRRALIDYATEMAQLEKNDAPE